MVDGGNGEGGSLRPTVGSLQFMISVWNLSTATSGITETVLNSQKSLQRYVTQVKTVVKFQL